MNDLVKWFSATPVVDTAAYASGDLIGEKLEFDLSVFRDMPGLMVQSVQIVDLDKQSAAVDLVLFESDPTGTTFTDQAALAVADADLSKVSGVAQVTTYAAFSDNSLGRANNLAIPARIEPTDGSAKLFAALVSRGTPTYTGASNLIVRVGVVAVG